MKLLYSHCLSSFQGQISHNSSMVNLTLLNEQFIFKNHCFTAKMHLLGDLNKIKYIILHLICTSSNHIKFSNHINLLLISSNGIWISFLVFRYDGHTLKASHSAVSLLFCNGAWIYFLDPTDNPSYFTFSGKGTTALMVIWVHCLACS